MRVVLKTEKMVFVCLNVTKVAIMETALLPMYASVNLDMQRTK